MICKPTAFQQGVTDPLTISQHEDKAIWKVA